eukprot:353059-Chlamydomonas_euryale.AAC.5
MCGWRDTRTCQSRSGGSPGGPEARPCRPPAAQSRQPTGSRRAGSAAWQTWTTCNRRTEDGPCHPPRCWASWRLQQPAQHKGQQPEDRV